MSRSYSRPKVAGLLLALAVPTRLCAQTAPPGATTVIPTTVGAPTPDSLAHLVLARFVAGTPEAFDSIYPDLVGREVQHAAVLRRAPRRADIGRVLWTDAQHAVLLLAGTVGTGNGGDQTNGVRRFSGLYEARRIRDEWTLVRQMPLDSANYFRGQRLHVTLTPGQGIHVLDTVAVSIGSPYGLVARLNNEAHLNGVRIDGVPVEYAFGGGVLYLKSAPRPRALLVLDYTIAESRTRRDSSDVTVPGYGAYFNTDVWHPFFNYDAEHDLEPFTVRVTLPAAYRLTTTLPQTESVAGDIRTVVGRSNQPAATIALIYDRDWHVEKSDRDSLVFESFVTPQFRFSHDSLAATARRVYAVMVPRFGTPQLSATYLGEVETRALQGQGMGPRINDMVTSGNALARLATLDTLSPSFLFAHEIVHGWTLNATGVAANFLREGWATYAEALNLRAVAGPDVARVFWERQRTRYMTGIDRSGYFGGFEGRQSILGNPDNGQIHYQKGSWVFRALEHVMGDARFDQGMREFIQGRREGVPAGYREFIAAMSHAAGRDMTHFVMPWLAGRYIPDLDARVEGRRVIVAQNQLDSLFELPLELALTTSSRTVRRTLRLTHRADTLDIRDLDAVVAVRIDPDHHFLLQRHEGELTRFELSASIAPDAKVVELSGDFSPKPVPATLSNGVWTVEIPMSEGRYLYAWRIDGTLRGPAGIATTSTSAPFGVRVVRPVQPLRDSYPR